MVETRLENTVLIGFTIPLSGESEFLQLLSTLIILLVLSSLSPLKRRRKGECETSLFLSKNSTFKFSEKDKMNFLRRNVDETHNKT
jgi:hypothetical protein